MKRNRIGISALAVALLAALPGAAGAARVDYVIDAGVEHDDNVLLDPVNPISQTIGRTGLGFHVAEATSTIQAMVDGRVDYRMFEDNVYSDSLEGTLSGHLNWVMIDDRLSFSVEDDLELQAINRFAPEAPDNRQQVNVLSLGPNLFFDLGRTMRGQVEARYIDTEAEVTEEFNSSRQGLALRAIKELGPTSAVSFNVQGLAVDFDDDTVARDHDRGDLFLRYQRQFAHLDLLLDAGVSTVSYDDGQDLHEPLLRVDLGWRTGGSSSFALIAVHQFHDAAEEALTDLGDLDDIERRIAIPSSVLVGGDAIEASVYRERRVEFTYAYAGDRTIFHVTPYVQQLEYVDLLVLDEDSRGLRLGLDYRMTPTLLLAAYGDYEDIDYDELGGISDKTRRLGLRLEKQWTRHWSTALSYARYDRDSALFGDVQQNVWYLSVAYRNRPR